MSFDTIWKLGVSVVTLAAVSTVCYKGYQHYRAEMDAAERETAKVFTRCDEEVRQAKEQTEQKRREAEASMAETALKRAEDLKRHNEEMAELAVKAEIINRNSEIRSALLDQYTKIGRAHV